MTRPHYQDDLVTVHHGDCLDVMATMPDASVHAVVTDPPYGLEFMGKEWDSFKTMPSGGAGLNGTGYTDGGNRLARPSFMGSPNPPCRNCGGTQRGADGQGVKRCRCDNPEFPNVRRAQSAAFGAWCEQWGAECLRVLKPGGHLLAFGGTRTWHRLAVAIEDAGFEIRDSIAWLYGSGFPKSLDVSRAIDAHQKHGGSSSVQKRRASMGDDYTPSDVLGKFRNGAIDTMNTPHTPAPEQVGERTSAAQQWAGWGTALKPAFEPIVVARKPLAGTVAQTVLAHGTGALNVDGCRVGTGDSLARPYGGDNEVYGKYSMERGTITGQGLTGRWPTNVVLDDTAAAELDLAEDAVSRFFPTFRYEAKAPTEERPRAGGVAHPTVKPLDLMRWLVRLVTPPGGTVLDPFAGSGTTAEACVIEGFPCITIEREADYLPLILARLTKPIEPVLDLGALA